MAYDPIPFVDAAGVAVWTAKVAGDANNRVEIDTNGQVSWGPGSAAVDTFMGRSAAGIVAFGEVDGVAAHSVYIYNSRSASGANQERGILEWSSNVFRVGTEQSGSGSARVLRLRGGGVDSFDINAGNVLFVTDNGNDVGGPSNRIRSIYWGTQALGPNGTVSAASFGFALEVNSGLIRTGTGILSIALTGDERFRWDKANGRTVIGSAWAMTWSSTSTSDGAPDLFLFRDAANTLAQRNGVNAQTVRWYGTFTNSTNYERVELTVNATRAFLTHRSAGTGSDRPFAFGVVNTRIFEIQTSGHTFWPTDNTYDLGGPSNRIRSVFVGAHIAVGGTVSSTGGVRVQNNLGIYYRNQANTADIRALLVNTSNQIILGGSGAGAVEVMIDGSGTGKIGMFNTTPVVQPSGTGETTGFVAGSGTGVNDDSTFTGNVGTKAYRISDMVKALKNLGAMAAS